jgi:hypothetical protein
MLLPTIKLKPELELSLLDSLITNRFYLHTSGYSIFEIFGNSTIAVVSNSNLFYINTSNDDFITNLVKNNIKQEYACYFWKHLSSNYSAIELLLQCQHQISSGMIASNTHPDAEGLIEKFYNKMRVYRSTYILSSNPRAINLLKKHIQEVSFSGLLQNPNPQAVELIVNHIDYSKNNIWDGAFLQNENCMELFIHYLHIKPELLDSRDDDDRMYVRSLIRLRKFSWYYLCLNPHPSAIKILKLFPENVNKVIVTNPCPDAYVIICRILAQHADTDTDGEIIRTMCKNTNPRVLELLDGYSPDLYDWVRLCQNPSAIPILMREENRNKIKVTYLLKNPNIFVYNYDNMRKNTEIFKEELIRKVWHPSNVSRWLEQGFDDFLES